MKQFRHILIFCAMFWLSGCGEKNIPVTSLSMLKGGKVFAVPTGTVADQMVLGIFPDAKIAYYNSVLDCALAVQEGKADAAAYDKPVLQNIAAKNEGLKVLDELLLKDQYGFAVQLENTELKKAMDETLAEIKADGTYEDMMKRRYPRSKFRLCDPAPGNYSRITKRKLLLCME